MHPHTAKWLQAQANSFIPPNMAEDRDTGPPERHRHGDKIIPFQVIERAKVGFRAKAGEVVMLNQSECSLDDMLHRGWLGGRQEDAERRHAAGMWLRELWLKLHGSIGVASYHDAWHRFVDISSNMSQVDAWNFKCLMETREFMGSLWAVLDAVCIQDVRYRRPSSRLQDALDVLAEHRGL